MRTPFRSAAIALAGALALSLPAIAQMTTKPLTPSQMVDPQILVARIEQNCGVFHTAIQTEQPTDVMLKTNVWNLVKDADITAAEKALSATTYAKVWKIGGNYNWIHAVTIGSKGGHNALQLCFRNDGTLARVKSATTIPALDLAGAHTAYYNTNGSLIQRTGEVSVNDPSFAMKVKSLPYYK